MVRAGDVELMPGSKFWCSESIICEASMVVVKCCQKNGFVLGVVVVPDVVVAARAPNTNIVVAPNKRVGEMLRGAGHTMRSWTWARARL